MFSPEQQQRIDAAAARMRVSYDPGQGTLLVTRMQHHAWLLFSVQPLAVTAMSANVQYHECITGAACPSWHETNAAWEVAQTAQSNLAAVPRAKHHPRSNITGSVAMALAVEDRVARFGGLGTERRDLPTYYDRLSTAERRSVERRKRGLVVL